MSPKNEGEHHLYMATDARTRATDILGFYWLNDDHVLIVTTTSVEIHVVNMMIPGLPLSLSHIKNEEI